MTPTTSMEVRPDFIHTENVVLIDKKKRIRGYYDGTDENAMKKLVSDIGKLL
ncbi:MAG: hypothetical protein CM15mP65_11870 [Crocinitomicaceae bacterium]|nr:MAG: hypothetical protein CM15mP65_11870 [Crocinitomicaceae bacterium]